MSENVFPALIIPYNGKQWLVQENRHKRTKRRIRVANGKAHKKINLVFLAIGIGAVLISSQQYVHGISVIIGYLFGTYWMNPDLDIKSNPYRRWGFLRFMWIPYQKFKHRSIWTHGYVIGDIIRYLYVMAWIMLGAGAMSILTDVPYGIYINHLEEFVIQHKLSFLSFIVGNMLSSTAHILTDHASTTFKKVF
ncbi:metal-binding protein [Bacillus sp. FJAT-27986]|uniref:metal-binding protein n=1 Tax=Bacillus sp. FJAT-27986 TaxID=1743146 RepID=UPI0015848CA9|nr:metal-binding protein [Bacillus sp. FJAT-27986]